MAVELITKRWCDWHMRFGGTDGGMIGEHVEGVEFSMAFAPAAHDPQMLTVDLCEECADAIGVRVVEVVKALELKQQGKRTPTADKVAGVKFRCPLGCDREASKTTIKKHCEEEHGLTLAQVAYKAGVTLEGTKVSHVCEEGHDDVPHAYGKPQAIAQHRMQGHGDDGQNLDLDQYLVTDFKPKRVRRVS